MPRADSFTQPIRSTNESNNSAVASFGTTFVGGAKTVQATSDIMTKCKLFNILYNMFTKLLIKASNIARAVSALITRGLLV